MPPKDKRSLSTAVLNCDVELVEKLLAECEEAKYIDDPSGSGHTTMMLAAGGDRRGEDNKRYRQILRSLWRRYKEVDADLKKVLEHRSKSLGSRRNLLGHVCSCRDAKNVELVLRFYKEVFTDLEEFRKDIRWDKVQPEAMVVLREAFPETPAAPAASDPAPVPRAGEVAAAVVPAAAQGQKRPPRIMFANEAPTAVVSGYERTTAAKRNRQEMDRRSSSVKRARLALKDEDSEEKQERRPQLHAHRRPPRQQRQAVYDLEATAARVQEPTAQELMEDRKDQEILNLRRQLAEKDAEIRRLIAANQRMTEACRATTHAMDALFSSSQNRGAGP